MSRPQRLFDLLSVLRAQGNTTVSDLSSREKDLLHAVGLDVDRVTQLGHEAVVKGAVGKLS